MSAVRERPKTSGVTIALCVLAAATVISVFAVPLLTPALAVVGAIGSIQHARHHLGAWRWVPVVLFGVALIAAVCIDLGVVAASTSVRPPTPATPIGG